MVYVCVCGVYDTYVVCVCVMCMCVVCMCVVCMCVNVLCVYVWVYICTVQFSSVTQLCPTLCNPMDCSMPGLPVHHPLLEFTQTHSVSDAIQPSHLL